MQPGPDFENALRACLVTGVVLVDGQTNLATLDLEARQILGLSPEQDSEVSVEVLPAEVAKVARETLASDKPGATRQVSVPAKDGNGFIVVSAIRLKPMPSHSAVLILQAMNSTTEFQRQIRQLDRLANAGTLAAGMAHEIKNALVASRTFLDLLLERNTDSDLAQVVRRETGRIDSIVSRMLRFAGTSVTSLSALHSHEVLDHALRLVQPHLSNKSISLQRLFQATSDLVKGDEYELEQAFVNLLLNAAEAMSENGKLTVASATLSEGRAAMPRLQITIQDTGAGILPEHMSHMFEPFFTTKASGTGLGLAITRRILQEHGGSVSVESRPGQGTTFTVFLPLLVERDGAPPAPFASPMLGNAKA